MYGLEEGSFFALAAAAAAAAASVEAGSAESKTAVSTVIFSDVSAIGKARCGGFGDVKFAIGVSGEASALDILLGKRRSVARRTVVYFKR